MRRFIRYLYEYDQEKKMRNVGFVKVEQGLDECVIHVHGKGFCREDNVQGLEVYLFWNTDDACTGILIGRTKVPEPALNYQLCYTPEDTGEKEIYDLVNGIILKDLNGHWYAAVWNEDVVNVCQMKLWTPAQEDQEERDDIPDTMNQKMAEPTEHLLRKTKKIQRKDMVCLPRCEWKHANNSFLIHGYYNYHHLILTVCDGQLKLGVPGVYYPQEARAAESFGFPEFLPVEELELELTDKEKEEEEKFGYWCRNVRGTKDCVEQKNQISAG